MTEPKCLLGSQNREILLRGHKPSSRLLISEFVVVCYPLFNPLLPPNLSKFTDEWALFVKLELYKVLIKLCHDPLRIIFKADYRM